MEMGDQRHRSPNSDGKGTVRGEEAVSGEGEEMTGLRRAEGHTARQETRWRALRR